MRGLRRRGVQHLPHRGTRREIDQTVDGALLAGPLPSVTVGAVVKLSSATTEPAPSIAIRVTPSVSIVCFTVEPGEVDHRVRRRTVDGPFASVAGLLDKLSSATTEPSPSRTIVVTPVSIRSLIKEPSVGPVTKRTRL